MASLKDYGREIETCILQWCFLRSGMDHDRIVIWLSAGAIALLMAKHDVFLAAHVDRVVFGVTLFFAILCTQFGLAIISIDKRYAQAINTSDGTIMRWELLLLVLEWAIRISFFSWSTLLVIGIFVKFFLGWL